MKFFNTKFIDYKYIKKLIYSNGRSLPPCKTWKKLWISNPTNKRLFPGEIFKLNKNSYNIYAYHSHFSKTLKIKKKYYRMEVSSNLNVHPKYRTISIQLLNRFFNKDADFFLTTTTGNFAVAKIWKAFGAYEVNPNSCSKVYYKIFNTANILRSFLIKKRIPKMFIKIIYVFFLPLFFFDIFQNNKKNILIYFQKVKKIDNEILNFNKNYEQNCKDPIEIRSGLNLQWYLNIIQHNKKIDILKIYLKDLFVGYAILALETNKDILLKRCFLAEIRINQDYLKFTNNILKNINVYSKNIGADILEIKNLDCKIFKFFDNSKYFLRYFLNNPYLILPAKKNQKLINKKILSNWRTTLLDGDCLL